MAAVTRHRAQVPEPFAQAISEADHHKAADYAVARTRLGRLDTVLDALVLLGLTVGGGITAIDHLSRRLALAEPWHGAIVVLAVLLVGIADRPAAVPVEHVPAGSPLRIQSHDSGLFVLDRLKGLALGLIIGGPLLLAALALMQHAGALWWLYVWAQWLACHCS